MPTIPSPLLEPSDPLHLAARESALEPSFRTIVDSAVAAGWRPDVIAAALVDLADANVVAAGGNAADSEAASDTLLGEPT